MARISLWAALTVGFFACATTAPVAPIAAADDGRHDAPMEWWYWSGHLTSDRGHRFGFHMTFFLVEQGFLIDHATVADLDGGLLQNDPGVRPVSHEGFELASGNSRALGGNGSWRLAAKLGTSGFELITTPGPVVFHHGAGFRAFPFGGHSYYYSRPRLPVAGTVTLDGEPLAVTGEAWFDHQWGELGPAMEAGWDWFGIQLDDGRTLMLVTVRPREGAQVIDGTWHDGELASEIDPAAVRIHSTGSWLSPRSGCTYPSGWHIELDDLELIVAPVLAAQEMVPPDAATSYWEGAADVTGSTTGRAYVELTGYCK